jgi:DNA mismatch endonuclease, patch repair protein
MSKIGGKNTKAEVMLRRELWRRGWRYRLHDRRLPGSPDIVFRANRVAVFVDGDYWHGRAFVEGGLRAIKEIFRGASRDYWIAKIKRNIARDIRTTEALVALGWSTVRVWERDVLFNLTQAADTVETALGRKKEPESKPYVTDHK